MRRTILLINSLILVIAVWGAKIDSPRQLMSFNDQWQFCLGTIDSIKANRVDYDASSWRTLNLPHDWAIEGAFSQDNPSGTGGGALPGGIGWYRKMFKVDKADKGKLFQILFDGVYMNSQVYLNGHLLGTRPYGYISFAYDLTPYLHWGTENVLLVRVDNSDQPNSRWYSGCGIYRNVWLTKMEPLHVGLWGTYVTTSKLTDRQAELKVETLVKNEYSRGVNVELTSILLDANGRRIASDYQTLKLKGRTDGTASQTLLVTSPVRWSLEKPYLYTVRTEVRENGKLRDVYQTKTGIRSFRFDAQKGFFLNEQSVKINGVCMHHDQGCLGAVANRRAIQRQLQILKAMGCNGIRCSHNPPSPELLELCDEMGFIVMDESFDMWRKKKSARDYARFFDQWHERDLDDLVLRDRNHPSIFMWSIGNEVLEQWSDANADTLSLEQANLILNFGHDASTLAKEGEMSVNSMLCRKLAERVKALDPTRPTTAGCNEPNPNNHLFRSGALDIIGYNYHEQWFDSVPRLFPNKPFIVTESVSALMTRGYYYQPSTEVQLWPERWDKPFFNETFSCSSFDQCHAPWGATHETMLDAMKTHDFISGQYIWTGFDYIGEPTPYGWPARSSYFGIVDLAGFPKDVYYLYQSEWSDKDVLHLFPHWNWTKGQQVDVWAYYNHADEVELYLNGQSMGKRSKKDHEYHVMWRLRFQPGELKAVSRKDGKVVKEQIIRTAGEPAQIRLTADRLAIHADGKDLSYVTVEVLDKDGNLCPNAENLVKFSVNGAAVIAGVDNGSPISLESFKAPQRKAFYGKCLVVLQNNGKSGKVVLNANSEGLSSSSLSMTCE